MKKFNVRKNNKKQINNVQPKGTLGSLRLKIFIMFFLFLITLMIYDTYFEGSSESSDDKNDLPKLLDSKSVYIFHDSFDNSTLGFYNPTIAKNDNNIYLIVFEKLKNDGSTELWFSNSSDGKKWSEPVHILNQILNSTKPHLITLDGQNFILSFEVLGQKYISIYNDPLIWNDPEPSELYSEVSPIYYDKEYIIIANETGLTRYCIEDLEDRNLSNTGEVIIKKQMVNVSFVKIKDTCLKIVHENVDNNNDSIVLTTLDFDKLDDESTDIKWDLLIIFVIIGSILVIMIVQEIARD
jgi:hypothetical protein